MGNDPLRTAIQAAGLTVSALAKAVGVRRMTVQRWLEEARIPHPGHRRAVARALGVDEEYLWPREGRPARGPQLLSAGGELVALYADRGEVPPSKWEELVLKGQQRIDIPGWRPAARPA